MIKLNKDKVPVPLHKIISIAEEWGIDDDYDREMKIEKASKEELEMLVSSIDDINDNDLYGWLEGKESYSFQPTEEYVCFTCLTMAIDSAKSRIKIMNKD